MDYYSRSRPKGPVNYVGQAAQLSEIRAMRPDLAVWSYSSEQATLRRLTKAFEAFFRRVKAGDEPGYPRFKSAHRFGSVEWPRNGDGCKWHPEATRVYLQGIGHVKLTQHRPVEGRLKTIQVKREGRRWFLVLSCDDVPTHELAETGRAVGIDVGIASFLTTSEGTTVDNPRHSRQAAGRLAAAQQVLAHKQRGSTNRIRARETVARRHRAIANQRRDFHHQVARRLVREFDVLVMEDLKITNMSRSAKATVEAPGTNVAAKRGLNREILDAGWGQFRSILAGKAEDAGRRVVSVDPRRTSQRCASCGHTEAGNRTSQATFRCRACGHVAHADSNAARNILGAGLALLAAEEPDAA